MHLLEPESVPKVHTSIVFTGRGKWGIIVRFSDIVRHYIRYILN